MNRTVDKTNSNFGLVMCTWHLNVIGKESSSGTFEVRCGVNNQQLEFLRIVQMKINAKASSRRTAWSSKMPKQCESYVKLPELAYGPHCSLLLKTRCDGHYDSQNSLHV